MAEIKFEERIKTIEATAVKVFNDTSKLRTEDELNAVIDQVFNELDDLENRITALKNNLEMVRRIIDTTNGK